MSERIKIMLAEDHEMFRRSLLEELGADARIEVLGGASDGKELLEMLRKTPADVVLLDLEMPVMNGFETFDRIKLEHPKTKVIILSGHFNFSLVNEFVDAGAGAYLPKNVDVDVLVDAIHIVYDKGYFLKIIDSLPEDRKEYAFTGLEMEILKAFCKGKSSEEVAKTLGKPRQVIDKELKQIYEKAEVHSVSELTLFAVRTGLISIHNSLFL
jgi:DNA-binding NarL/FixJ family response regulator